MARSAIRSRCSTTSAFPTRPSSRSRGLTSTASFDPDHLTALWIPQLAAPVAVELVRFAELVRTLRRECPWDREQTHRSLTRHLLEETYETLEAIEALDDSDTSVAHLEEELGDLLFQVFFHATLAAEEGWFTLADVARVHPRQARPSPSARLRRRRGRHLRRRCS